MIADIAAGAGGIAILYALGHLFLTTPWGITLGCHVSLIWGWLEGMTQRMRERMKV